MFFLISFIISKSLRLKALPLFYHYKNKITERCDKKITPILSRTHCVWMHFEVKKGFLWLGWKWAQVSENLTVSTLMCFSSPPSKRGPHQRLMKFRYARLPIWATLFPVKPQLISQKDYSTTPSHIHIRCLFPLLIFLANVTICQSLSICCFNRCFSAQKWIYNYSSTYWNTTKVFTVVSYTNKLCTLMTRIWNSGIFLVL